VKRNKKPVQFASIVTLLAYTRTTISVGTIRATLFLRICAYLCYVHYGEKKKPVQFAVDIPPLADTRMIISVGASGAALVNDKSLSEFVF
jgi:hypothetical protein